MAPLCRGLPPLRGINLIKAKELPFEPEASLRKLELRRDIEALITELGNHALAKYFFSFHGAPKVSRCS